jgi:hypothetical protein
MLFISKSFEYEFEMTSNRFENIIEIRADPGMPASRISSRLITELNRMNHLAEAALSWKSEKGSYCPHTETECLA